MVFDFSTAFPRHLCCVGLRLGELGSYGINCISSAHSSNHCSTIPVSWHGVLSCWNTPVPYRKQVPCMDATGLQWYWDDLQLSGSTTTSSPRDAQKIVPQTIILPLPVCLWCSWMHCKHTWQQCFINRGSWEEQSHIQ